MFATKRAERLSQTSLCQFLVFVFFFSFSPTLLLETGLSVRAALVESVRLLVRLKVLLEVDGRFVLRRVQMLVTRASGPVSRFVSDFTSVSPPLTRRFSLHIVVLSLGWRSTVKSYSIR